MHSRQVEIKSPCHESWDAMHGDDARRFCDVCAKHVHNLSAMDRSEARALLDAHRGEHLCVRYSSHDDGSVAFRDQPIVPKARLRVARSAFAAVMLAACTPHGDGPPIQQLGEAAIESLARDATPASDGGCSVQTGPLTTLHFPAGHKVCEHLADQGDRVAPPLPPPPISAPTMGEAPIVAPPPLPEVMGAMAPPEPRPKMGEAMPEVKEPCDPPAPPAPPTPPPGEQGFAPPPPPSPPPGMLMGDIAVEPAEPPLPPVRPKMGKIKRPLD